jgi:hypothetical protein
MANLQKYTKNATGHLTKHYERGNDENGELTKFGNQNIDINQSFLNYNLAPGRDDLTQIEYIKKRTSEVKCLKRKDVNVMCTWIVTIPKSLTSEDNKKFFDVAYNFLENRYGGKKNVISAYVHLDETTPHMHFAFVPIAKDKKKGHLKVSAKEVTTRKDLQTFHNDLSEEMEKHFGRDIGIQNGSTRNGNKAIQELKRENALETLKSLQDAKKDLEDIESSLLALKAEYDVKRAFIDQSITDYKAVELYPDYAKVNQKGIINKKVFVTVPKKEWEQRYRDTSQIYSIEQGMTFLDDFENLVFDVKNILEENKNFEKRILKKELNLEKQMAKNQLKNKKLIATLKLENISLENKLKKVTEKLEFNKLFSKKSKSAALDL